MIRNEACHLSDARYRNDLACSYVCSIGQTLCTLQSTLHAMHSCKDGLRPNIQVLPSFGGKLIVMICYMMCRCARRAGSRARSP